MEVKPKSVKLINLEEELLPSGRKLLHCIFQNRYGSGFQYKWTAPWRDKESEYGVQRLFFRCLATEEWNDYDGVWSEELRKVSREVPLLEDMVLPVKIEVGGVTEIVDVVEEGKWESLVVEVNILSEEENVMTYRGGGEDYIRVGDVRMAWASLKSELDGVKGVDSVSEGIQRVRLGVPDGDGGYVDVEGVGLGVRVDRRVGRNEYQAISLYSAFH
jgi:hypothetical protein